MKTEDEIRQLLVIAAQNADWAQVVANGGPPCFYLEGERFCLRAQRWGGHGETDHQFVSLATLLSGADLFAAAGGDTKTPEQIRQLRDTLKMFDRPTEAGYVHVNEVRVLDWVLGEYPLAPKPRVEAPAPDPSIVQPMFPGGFPVRNFPGMRTKKPEPENKPQPCTHDWVAAEDNRNDVWCIKCGAKV